jgi:hypothetical protein
MGPEYSALGGGDLMRAPDRRRVAEECRRLTYQLPAEEMDQTER